MTTPFEKLISRNWGKPGANTLEVLRSVDIAVADAQRQDPDVHLVPAVTQGDFIRESSSATLEALGLAIVLSILVIQPFLGNWRATAISTGRESRPRLIVEMTVWVLVSITDTVPPISAVT